MRHLHVSRLDAVFDVCATEEEALAVFGST